MKHKDIPVGLVKIYWKSGGSSLAAVGVGPTGQKWFAPTNWVAPSSDKCIPRWIEKVEVIQ